MVVEFILIPIRVINDGNIMNVFFRNHGILHWVMLLPSLVLKVKLIQPLHTPLPKLDQSVLGLQPTSLYLKIMELGSLILGTSRSVVRLFNTLVSLVTP